MEKPGIPFVEFPKISRYNRGVIVTEKLDGTNAQIYIPDPDVCACQHSRSVHYTDGTACSWGDGACDCSKRGGFRAGADIYAGSRTKWISPQDDNMGFARWVEANKAELLRLGPGSHFGEWWGSGIQRNYGLKEKRFSLFNVNRWGDANVRPACCGVVPTLWAGLMEELDVNEVLRKLVANGSYAAPGFMKPEGIVVFCTAGGQLFKKTVEKDDQPKGK